MSDQMNVNFRQQVAIAAMAAQIVSTSSGQPGISAPPNLGQPLDQLLPTLDSILGDEGTDTSNGLNGFPCCDGNCNQANSFKPPFANPRNIGEHMANGIAALLNALKQRLGLGSGMGLGNNSGLGSGNPLANLFGGPNSGLNGGQGLGGGNMFAGLLRLMAQIFGGGQGNGMGRPGFGGPGFGGPGASGFRGGAGMEMFAASGQNGNSSWSFFFFRMRAGFSNFANNLGQKMGLGRPNNQAIASSKGAPPVLTAAKPPAAPGVVTSEAKGGPPQGVQPGIVKPAPRDIV